MSKPLNQDLQAVVCIDNGGCPASLELHKIYRTLPDADAAAQGDLRVVDESGEACLFPASAFAPIKVPDSVQASLLGQSVNAKAEADSAEQWLHAYFKKFRGRSLANELIAERRDDARRESGF